MYKIVAVVVENPAFKEHVESLETRHQEVEAFNAKNVQRTWIKFTEQYGGYGMIALRDFCPGEVVVKGIQLREDPKSIHSITGPDGREYKYNLSAATINHSCDPSTVPFDEGGEYVFVGRKAITAGQEVFWNYNATEPVISFFNMASKNPGECFCKSECCVKIVKGFGALSPGQLVVLETQRREAEEARGKK